MTGDARVTSDSWTPSERSDDSVRTETSMESSVSQDAATAAPAPEVAESAAGTTRVMVDPRGQRFSAAISVVVMGLALVVGLETNSGIILLTAQGVAFGLGSMFGLRFQPYGWLYRSLVRPRLGPPTHFEEEQPPRFAQLVGFIFVILALVGVTFSLVALAYVAVGFAIAAAFLNAAFGFCLGCQIYLTFKRMTTKA